jgi:[ribosomal protein S5]-alanine N-acetyltransferase
MENASGSRSARLGYEPQRADHALDFFSGLSDPRVSEYFGDEPEPMTLTAMTERFARASAGPPPQRSHEVWLNYAVRLLLNQRLIGRLEATIVDHRAEVAYLFDPREWGQGYATEAVAWLQDHCFASAAVREFWATVAPSNERSMRLLARLSYQEISPSSGWPTLASYDPGDRVFCLISQQA